MPGKATGRAAAELPWLCPSTDSLITLAEAPASAVGLSDADPALASFLLRFATPAPEPDQFGFAPGALLSPTLPATAAAYLAATQVGVIPHHSITTRRVRDFAERASRVARYLADVTRLAPERAASTVARLAPLGWYGILAVDPNSAGDPLADPKHDESPAEVQARSWGLDHAAVTRRLATRWRFPSWVASTIGCLALPFRVASPLVSHPDIFAIVQLAVQEVEITGTSLGLTHGADRTELLAHLRLPADVIHGLTNLATAPVSSHTGTDLDPNPHRVPLVAKLLRMAAESRRRNGHSIVVRLEEQVDHLHRVAAELGEQAGARLRDAKLEGLAELAAGAGHEINNPLAVISGNAQRLLRAEHDPDRRESLQSIVRQAHRISGILRDLIQFARPPKPQRRTFPIAELLDGVRDEIQPLADERGVTLEFAPPTGCVLLDGDPGQLRDALRAVVRNAVEAANSPGWVRVGVTTPDDGCDVTLSVEDNGSGLSAEVAEHAFDPFYSGRSAGRGRGLGLPTAWQLIRQNGGAITYAPAPDSPTRFVLTLRRAVGHDLLTLRSA